MYEIIESAPVLDEWPDDGTLRPGFDFYIIEAKLENLIGDKAYDSDKLDAELREDGIEMILPHKSNRKKKKTQDGRRLRLY